MNLLQTATLPQSAGPTWNVLLGAVWTIALLVIGWLQKRAADDRIEMRGELKEVRDHAAGLRDELTVLNTHVGVDGNGIFAKLADLSTTMHKMNDAVQTLGMDIALIKADLKRLDHGKEA